MKERPRGFAPGLRSKRTSAWALALVVTIILAACGGADDVAEGDDVAAGEGGTEAGADQGDPGAADHWPPDAGFESDLESIIAAAEQESSLHYCSGYREDEWEQIYAAFQERFPDVAEMENSTCRGTGPRERVFSEWAAQSWDVGLFAVAIDTLPQFIEAELGAVIDWSIFDGTEFEIPDDVIHPSGRLGGVGAVSRVFIYNEDLVSPEDLPDSFEECADPQYRGQFIMDVRPSGGYTVLYDKLGAEGLAEWAQAIAANEPLWARAPSPINTALLAGERAWVCGSQIHGPLAGFIEWEEGGVVPEGQTLNMKAPTDNSHSAGREPLMIANYPEAPNTALLFAACTLSGQCPGPGDVNPGYGDPFMEGSWKQQWFENEGVEINETPGGRWADVELTEESSEIIVDAWEDPVPVIQEEEGGGGG